MSVSHVNHSVSSYFQQGGTNSSANHLWEKKWGFVGTVSSLIISKQDGHPWVSSKSYGESWFFSVSHYADHEKLGDFTKQKREGKLSSTGYWRHRTQVKFTVVKGKVLLDKYDWRDLTTVIEQDKFNDLDYIQ